MAKTEGTIGAWECKCGNTNASRYAECAKCKAPRPKEWNCPKCQNLNLQNAPRCAKCREPNPRLPRLELGEHAEEEIGKAAIIVTSVLSGIGSGVLLVPLIGWLGIIFAITIALAYPALGALTISLCESLRRWATVEVVTKWTRNERLFLGAFWPLTLIGCLIVYTFLGIIRRIY